MDKAAYEATPRTVGKWIVPLAKAQHVERLYETECKDHALIRKTLDRVIAERDQMLEWILQAAPMLSVASCIVIDEAVERLGEIAGCRGVLELCPVDFINLENAIGHAPGAKEKANE